VASFQASRAERAEDGESVDELVDELTIVAIGDVHLGMRPASLPENLDHEGVDPRTLTPEAALSATVDYILDVLRVGVDGPPRGVDAVVFAGDVVESTNARFEALRPLETAVRRLLDAGIPVFAVVGNHDVEALPRLARMIEGFELLGEGGQWQARLIEKVGGPAIELLGWSFPERQVRGSPVDQLLRHPLAPLRAGVPRIGLLHADLDASGGNYAPISSSELDAAGLDAWLLGHIHKPSLPEGRSREGVVPNGYLGSLVGLDPSEVGPRGPWLVRVDGRGDVTTRHLPIAPLRWERFELQVEPDEGPEDLGDRLLAEIVRVGEEISLCADGLAESVDESRQESGISAIRAPRVLGLRPILVGPTLHYEELRQCIASGRWSGLTRSAGSTLVFIDKVLDGLALAHDLETLALGDDPAALMARKLLLLKEPSKARSLLLDSARDALRPLALEPRWRALDQERNARDPLADDSAVAAILTRAGTETLNALLEQRDGASRTGV